jgi:DNA-binding GntR family transcriptional regulator
VTLDVDDARLLQVPPHTAVLLRTRLTFDAGGRAVLYDQGLYRSVYRLEWDGRQISAMDTAVAASL